MFINFKSAFELKNNVISDFPVLYFGELDT